MSPLAPRWWVVGALVALAGCGVVRENQLGDRECPDYEATLQPLVQAECADCHSGESAKAGYVVGDYAQTASRRWDGKAWADPGNPDSLFVAAVRGDNGHPRAEEKTVAALTDWAVRCRAVPNALGWHQRGWVSPTDDERFHGKYLRNGGADAGMAYPFEECAQCHGDDLKGGKTGKSCERCHTEGVTACNTCHGSADNFGPPRALNGAWGTKYVGVGAHQSHLKAGALGKKFDCEVCHTKPKDVLDDGHWRNGGTRDVSVAEVKIIKSGAGGDAQWNHSAATCTNGYCHAPAAADATATLRAPKWTSVGENQAACGTCHGAPPASHADDRCEVCHGAGYSKTTTNPLTHLDFKLDLRGDGSDCSACHAAPNTGAFVDLHGSTDATQKSVGAHQKHLLANRFRGPMNCVECHRVPTELHSPGHIDSAGPAEAFTTGVGLAYTDFAAPAYDATASSCSNVYCHGAGRKAALDTASTKATTPVWNHTQEQVVCGSCHGTPPQDGSVAHTGRALTDCVNCHALTVDATGAIRFTVDPVTGVKTSTHIDGKVTGNQ